MSESWGAWRERYRDHLELAGFSRRTVGNRLWALDKFLSWTRELGLNSPSDCTVAILAEYRRHRIERVNVQGRRDGAMTVNLHLAALRDFLAVLALKGATPAALAMSLGRVREPHRLPKTALTHAEMMRILECIPGDMPVHLRDRAALEVLYSTGLRRQELADLSVADVDLDGEILRVEQGKGGKGRIVPLGRHAADWVGRYLTAGRPALLRPDVGTDALFLSRRGGKLNGNAVREIVRRWAKAAGIEKGVTPHTFRRSCATGMIRNRANPAHVKDLLGHEDFTSLNAYVRLEIADLKEAHRKFHPRERLGGGEEEAGAGVKR